MPKVCTRLASWEDFVGCSSATPVAAINEEPDCLPFSPGIRSKSISHRNRTRRLPRCRTSRCRSCRVPATTNHRTSLVDFVQGWALGVKRRDIPAACATLALGEIARARLLAESRSQNGGGSSPRSLSRWVDLGRQPFGNFGGHLPDAVLHGKRSLRSRSRTGHRLSRTWLV